MPTKAEGSANLTSNGGYRPFTEWYGATTAGVVRHQVIKVYAYAGEVIYFGSSVYNSMLDVNGNKTSAVTGIDIVALNPLGVASTYDVIQNGKGFINNYTQEQTGPIYSANGNNHNAGGYNPFSITADRSGVWEFHFHSTENGNANPTSVTTTSTYTQSNGTIGAWDVTVTKPVYGNVSQPTQVTDYVPVPGRTFTNFLSLNMGGNKAGTDMLKSVVYVLTNDGYIYRTDFNGMDPYGFIYFSNNRGLVSGTTDAPLYRSVRDSKADNGLVNLKSDGVEFQNPTNADTLLDRTYKIFFQMPADDLPESIKPEKAYAPSKVTDFRFIGYDTNKGYVGHGGYFYFNVQNASSAILTIDLTHYTDSHGNVINGGKVVIDNAVVEGENRFRWDGRDANGNIVPAGVYGEGSNLKITITTKAGEYHFPMLDVENNSKGVKIRLMNDVYDFNGVAIPMTEAERSTVYYNNAAITNSTGLTNVTNPVTGVTGISGNQLGGIDSSNGACIFNGTGNSDGGDKCAIDVWTYFKAASAPSTMSIPYFELVANPANVGNIDGFVFYDKSTPTSAANGVYSISEGDAALRGITVNLKNSSGTVIATTTTDVLGQYSFMGLPYGNYSVVVVKPSSVYGVTTTSSGGTETQAIALNSTTVNASYTVSAKDVGYTYTIADKAVTINKVWAVSKAIDTAQPTSVNVTLTATYTKNGVNTTYDYTTVTLSSTNNWHVTFNTLPKYYRDSGVDYLLTYGVREWDFGGNYVSNVSLVESTTEKQFTVTNTPKGMIVLTKKDVDTSATLSGAVFELYRGSVTDSVADVLVGTYTTNDSGYITVNVPIEATYYFKEITAPRGYTINSVPTTGNIVVSFSSSGSVSYVTMTNKKIGCDMTLTKNITEASTVDQQFLFQIKGSSGNTLYASLVIPAGQTSVSQKVWYLPPGTYTVTELSNNWRYIVVAPSTRATDGILNYSYNVAAGSLTMPMSDPHQTGYRFIFTNILQNNQWESGNDHVTNKMVTTS